MRSWGKQAGAEWGRWEETSSQKVAGSYRSAVAKKRAAAIESFSLRERGKLD
jgi:hypothetical protein